MKPSSLSYYHVVSQISARERMEIDMEFHIQPQNLLLDSQGNLKVSDFGLSVLRKVAKLIFCPPGVFLLIIGIFAAWRPAIYCMWLSKLRSTRGKKQFSCRNTI
ncbi:hypothetical protein CsSME_00015481 [Camellia sinensis var. sinensis]